MKSKLDYAIHIQFVDWKFLILAGSFFTPTVYVPLYISYLKTNKSA